MMSLLICFSNFLLKRGILRSIILIQTIKVYLFLFLSDSECWSGADFLKGYRPSRRPLFDQRLEFP